jgi:hypothetical protein
MLKVLPFLLSGNPVHNRSWSETGRTGAQTSWRVTFGSLRAASKLPIVPRAVRIATAPVDPSENEGIGRRLDYASGEFRAERRDPAEYLER